MSKPIFTPNFLAIMLLTLAFTSGIFTLANTLFAKPYIKSAIASFSGIPRDLK